jgi:phosphoglycerate dehydrogenase-like enzyme
MRMNAVIRAWITALMRISAGAGRIAAWSRHIAMLRIAVLDDYQGVSGMYADWSQLPVQHEVTAFRDHLDDEGALARRLEPFDVIVAMRERTRFRHALIERLPNLRLMVSTGAKNASIDVAALTARDIPVCGTGAVPSGTAELTWALVLAVARHIPEEVGNVRSGGWQTTVGIDLAGKRLGIIGLGRLGTRVARVGQAFEMDVVAWSQNLTDERAAAAGVQRVDNEQLFRTADVVTVHLQLSERTRGLIGADELALMKPTAILVNTSRGPIVDEQALVAALRAGRLRGAGIDVYDREPLPADSPLRSAPRLVATPHLGYVTEATYEVFFRDAVEDVAAWLAGSPIRQLG